MSVKAVFADRAAAASYLATLERGRSRRGSQSSASHLWRAARSPSSSRQPRDQPAASQAGSMRP